MMWSLRSPRLIAAGAGALVLLALAGAVREGLRAEERLEGPVRARVLSVIDGDTLLVRARIWLGQEVEIRVRLGDIDSPELRSRCAAERTRAERARALAARAAGGKTVTLTEIRYGKYAGRILARVALEDGRDLGAILIAAGLARPYAGGRREAWCPTGLERAP